MSGPDRSGSPLVTVVMNCNNGERFLKEAIDSVYAQTWPDWEIVFWDNASTDSSAAIAQSYDDRVRYFRAPVNTSLGEARRLAFAEARGDFIAMLDSDDVWLPHTLRSFVSSMDDDENSYAVCYAGVVRIDAAGHEVGRTVPVARRGMLFGDFLRSFDVLPSASIVRRSVLIETGHSFDGSLTASEEVCFFMTLAVQYPFRSLPECLARYRVHEGALTNRSIARWADEWEYAVEQIRRSHPGIDARYRSGFRHIAARIDYYRARNLIHEGNSRAARRLLKRHAFVDVRFFGLFVVALFPSGVWNALHGWYHRRRQYS